MRGRHPKPPELRQRRNKTTTAATLDAQPDQFAMNAAPAPTTSPAARKRAARAKTPRAKAKAVRTRRRGAKEKAVRTRQRGAKSTQPPTRASAIAKAPNLPKGYHWHPETLDWWRDAWASPMALHWLVSDAHVLRRLAVLVNEYWHRPTPTVLAEVRQQQALLGLTPMDRHRLQWKIDMAAKPGEDADEADAPPPPADDPRQTMRLVK